MLAGNLAQGSVHPCYDYLHNDPAADDVLRVHPAVQRQHMGLHSLH